PAVVVATLRDVLIAPVARNALRHLVRDVQRGQLRLACPCHLPSSSPLQSARRKAVPGPRGVKPWPIGPFVQDRRHIPYPDGTPAHPIVERLRSPSRPAAPAIRTATAMPWRSRYRSTRNHADHVRRLHDGGPAHHEAVGSHLEHALAPEIGDPAVARLLVDVDAEGLDPRPRGLDLTLIVQ